MKSWKSWVIIAGIPYVIFNLFILLLFVCGAASIGGPLPWYHLYCKATGWLAGLINLSQFLNSFSPDVGAYFLPAFVLIDVVLGICFVTFLKKTFPGLKI